MSTAVQEKEFAVELDGVSLAGTGNEFEGTEQGLSGDVEGRHMAWNPYCHCSVWHSNVLYGAALAVNGNYYIGYHYHPYGTALAIFV